MVLLIQYRMTLKVVSQHLALFNSSWEFVSAIADTMAGKTLFVDSDGIAKFLLLKHTNMPISTLVFFIVTSV